MGKVNYDEYLKKVGTSNNKVASNYIPDQRYSNSAGNYYSGGSLVSPTGEQTLATNNSTSSTNASTNNASNMWNLYSKQIAQSSINQKAELAAINEKANSYTNAYLKSLGLSGTSAGANAIANNNVNLMNAYADVNANEQQALEEKRTEQNSKLMDLYETAVASGASSSEIKNIINNNAATPEDASYYNSMLEASGINWTSDRDSIINDLESNTEGLSEVAKNYATLVENQLRNASNEQEYNEVYTKYKEIFNNPQLLEVYGAVNSSDSQVAKVLAENADKLQNPVEGDTITHNGKIFLKYENGKWTPKDITAFR